MDIIYTQNPTETQPFFDFEFKVLAWQLVETIYWWGGGH